MALPVIFKTLSQLIINCQTQGVTNNSNDDHTYMWYLYVYSNNDDDDYVYKTMRLKPNTTYTISVYGKKTAATIAPWHFVIHDGMDTNYNWADAIKSQDFELEQTNISIGILLHLPLAHLLGHIMLGLGSTHLLII